MNIERLKELKAHLLNGESYYSVHIGDRKLGIDEFASSEDFIKEYYELSDRDFKFLFVDAGHVKVCTTNDYILLLSAFIHANE